MGAMFCDSTQSCAGNRYGVNSNQLTVDDYEALLERGWMRSGTFLYQSSNSTTCCPNIPIKIDVTKFRLSKSQKRVVSKFHAALDGRKPLVMPYDAPRAPASADGAGAERTAQNDTPAPPVGTNSTPRKPKPAIKAAAFFPQQRRHERFGPAPHRLSVELIRPTFMKEAYELYYRFNTEIHRGDTHDNTPSKYANHLVATPLIPAPARRHVHPAESPLPTWRTRISPNGTCAEAVDTPSRERWVGPATLRKIILEVKNRVPVHSPILTGTSTPDAGEPSGPRVPPGAASVSPPGHYQVDLGEYVPVGVGVELLDTKFAWGTHALGLAIEQEYARWQSIQAKNRLTAFAASTVEGGEMGSFESNAPPPPTGRHAGTDIQLVHMAVLEQAMDVLPKLQDAMHWDDSVVKPSLRTLWASQRREMEAYAPRTLTPREQEAGPAIGCRWGPQSAIDSSMESEGGAYSDDDSSSDMDLPKPKRQHAAEPRETGGRGGGGEELLPASSCFEEHKLESLVPLGDCECPYAFSDVQLDADCDWGKGIVDGFADRGATSRAMDDASMAYLMRHARSDAEDLGEGADDMGADWAGGDGGGGPGAASDGGVSPGGVAASGIFGSGSSGSASVDTDLLVCMQQSVSYDEVSRGRVHVEGWDLSMGYGTFHQLYRIDGVLVAVSVLDILPTRVASVYCFYDPDLRHIELGKFTALMEMSFTRRAFQYSPCLRWYDLNFYVHDCPSMNYKRHFQPALLQCPVTYQWVPLEAALKRLDEDKHNSLVPAGSNAGQATAYEREDMTATVCVPHMLVQATFRSHFLRLDRIALSMRPKLQPKLLELFLKAGRDMSQRALVDPALLLQVINQDEAKAAAAEAAARANKASSAETPTSSVGARTSATAVHGAPTN